MPPTLQTPVHVNVGRLVGDKTGKTIICRGQIYRNSRRMAINKLAHLLCREEEVGFVNVWGCLDVRADMFMRDGLHLSGKGAAVFTDELSLNIFLEANIV